VSSVPKISSSSVGTRISLSNDIVNVPVSSTAASSTSTRLICSVVAELSVYSGGVNPSTSVSSSAVSSTGSSSSYETSIPASDYSSSSSSTSSSPSSSTGITAAYGTSPVIITK